jgi:HK97 family phage major capsid protein
MPPQTQDMTLPQVAEYIFGQFFTDPAIRSATPEQRPALVAARFNDMVKAEAERQLVGVTTQLTDLQAAFTEMREKAERRETWRAQEFGFHRGIDGKIKPNVRKETAVALFNLVRALNAKNMDEVRAVSTTTNSEGGYLVATEIAADVLRLIPETGLYPSIAREMPLGTGKLDIGSVLSQMGAYWPGENSEITESFPAFGKLSLEGKLCGSLIPIPLALINNATPAMGQLFADLIRECIMKEIDRVFIVGKSVANGGTDVFDGLVNASSIVVVSLATGKTKVSDIDPDTILTMQTAVPEGARADCSYIMEPTVLDNLRKVKTSTGEYVNAHYYTPPSGTEPAKLWGKPVYETSRMPAYSNVSQPSKRVVLYGAFKQWAIFGNNQDLAIATSDVAGDAFKNCQLLIRGTTTVGGAAFGPAIAVLELASS